MCHSMDSRRIRDEERREREREPIGSMTTPHDPETPKTEPERDEREPIATRTSPRGNPDTHEADHDRSLERMEMLVGR
jgi:hypothetical protein